MTEQSHPPESLESDASDHAAPIGSSRFEGRVAVVTGAGSGIGAAVARRWVAEGGAVLLLGRTESKLRDLAAKLPTERREWLAIAHESASDVRRAVEFVERRWGRIDLLFNNAGTYHPATVLDTDDEAWAEALATNLTGPFVMTRSCLPLLRRTPDAVVVNNASTLGLRPIAGTAAYSVAKAGLVMLTQLTALEEAAHGVRAVAVCPGVVDTPIHASSSADAQSRRQFLEGVAALHPLGRIGTAEEVAALVLFLASSESAWTTGSIIPIDGGIALT